MKTTGRDLITAVANRLAEQNVRCYDSAIVAAIQSLSATELNQLVAFGDVTKWHNERIERNESQST